jgi:hypothetical protein
MLSDFFAKKGRIAAPKTHANRISKRYGENPGPASLHKQDPAFRSTHAGYSLLCNRFAALAWRRPHSPTGLWGLSQIHAGVADPSLSH